METLSRHVAIVRVIGHSIPVPLSHFSPASEQKREQCQLHDFRDIILPDASYVLSLHVLTMRQKTRSPSINNNAKSHELTKKSVKECEVCVSEHLDALEASVSNYYIHT